MSLRYSQLFEARIRTEWWCPNLPAMVADIEEQLNERHVKQVNFDCFEVLIHDIPAHVVVDNRKLITIRRVG